MPLLLRKRIWRGILSLCLILCLISTVAHAEANKKPFFEPPRNPRDPRQFLLPPIMSFLIPGFDQWWEGQYGPATYYSIAGATGILIGQTGKNSTDNRYKDLSWQFYFTAGSLSLYHSFRTAVTTLQPQGLFTYLPEKAETPLELLGASADFTYLGRLTTILPLAAAAGLFFIVSPNKSDEAASVSFGDLVYSSSVSYMTGIGEEALFRGYMLPMMNYYTDNNQRLSLGVTSLFFALGHGLRFKHFVTSFFFGLYAGWLVQESNWTLGEVTFIHTWWDIMAFLADYANHREHAFLRLPSINIRF